MRLGTRSFGAVPLVSLLVAGAVDTVAIVTGAVFVILALLTTALIVWKGVAPWLEWGPLKAGFTRLGRTPTTPPPTDESRAPPDSSSSASRIAGSGEQRPDQDSNLEPTP